MVTPLLANQDLTPMLLVAAVQSDFRCKSRTEQNKFGNDNIGQNKCAIHKQLPR